MGVELAKSLFMGIHLKMAAFKWVLYWIKNILGLCAVSTFRSLINIRFQQHSTKYNKLNLTARSLTNLCPNTQHLIFINEYLENMYD